MTQEEIIELLKQQPDKWFSATEIAKQLNTGKHSTQRNMTRLIKYQEVHFQKRQVGPKKHLERLIKHIQ